MSTLLADLHLGEEGVRRQHSVVAAAASPVDAPPFRHKPAGGLLGGHGLLAGWGAGHFGNSLFFRIGLFEFHGRVTLVRLPGRLRACSRVKPVLRIGAVGERAHARVQQRAVHRSRKKEHATLGGRVSAGKEWAASCAARTRGAVAAHARKGGRGGGEGGVSSS